MVSRNPELCLKEEGVGVARLTTDSKVDKTKGRDFMAKCCTMAYCATRSAGKRHRTPNVVSISINLFVPEKGTRATTGASEL